MRMTSFLLLLLAPASSCDLLSGKECSGDADCHGTQVCSADGACVQCKSDDDCDGRETCVDGSCERGGAGEGEGSVGEGEGSVGEGEGSVGEGEGSVGEGEGSVGEGEGEGGPVAGLTLTLTWDTDTDLDIHATQGPSFCIDPLTTASAGTYGPVSQSCAPAPADCNYTNCKTSSFSSRTEWDGVTGVTGGDPTLEIDDLDGRGPEIIDVSRPVIGTYLVGAFYYGQGTTATPPSTAATLTVSVNGTVQKIVHATLPTTDAWSDLAVVHFESGGVFCIGDVSDGVDECP